ncbi:hypothetical protein GCM10010400_49850 [Streptomyces aculeolatus]
MVLPPECQVEREGRVPLHPDDSNTPRGYWQARPEGGCGARYGDSRDGWCSGGGLQQERPAAYN